MRTFPYSCLLLSLLWAFLWMGCSRDLVEIRTTDGEAANLSVSTASLDLSAMEPTETALTFSWVPADYGFNASVQYTLQLDRAGNAFGSARDIALEALSSDTLFTVEAFNTILVLMGLEADVETPVEARIMSVLGTDKVPLYSNAVTINVIPYAVLVEYPYLLVPGGYQGWDAAAAPRIASIRDDGQYEGYVYFPEGADLTFKFTNNTDWEVEYGWTSSTNTDDYVEGTMSSDASGNLFVPGSGYYLIRANTMTGTWSATQVTFGIVGDAANGWESDRAMQYDATSGEWRLETDLSSGNFKFWANQGWTINYGLNEPDNGFLRLDGANLHIAEAGRYVIALRLANPGNYTYSLEKIN